LKKERGDERKGETRALIYIKERRILLLQHGGKGEGRPQRWKLKKKKIGRWVTSFSNSIGKRRARKARVQAS